MKGRYYLAVAAGVAAAVFLVDPPGARADLGSNNCVLVGRLRAPPLIEVYNESPSGGNGSLIWAGWIGRDQTLAIHSSNGRLRYNYRYDATGPWNANVGAWCRNNSRVTVP